MGVTLSEVGTGPDGHGQLVSWSGDVTDGQQEIANASAYPLLPLAVQGTKISVNQQIKHFYQCLELNLVR